MTRIPVDEADRVVIRTNLAETVFVEAGAGSGKTRELVQRLVNLVLAGTPLPRIAAITFTNAAAAELRERVRVELARLSRSEDERVRDLANAALESIDSAAIQTLHSFAQSILALHPVEAGLPPELTPQDEVAASVAFDDHWQRFLEDLLEDGCGDREVADAVVRGFLLGLSERNLRRIAEKFHEEWDRALAVRFDQAETSATDATEYLRLVDEALALRDDALIEEDAMVSLLDNTVRPIVEHVREAQKALEQAHDHDERLAAEGLLFAALDRPFRTWGSRSIHGTGRQPNWKKGSLPIIKSSLSAAGQLQKDLLYQARQSALLRVLGALQGFVREFRDERVREGTIEFQDMLYLARDLLRSNIEVRHRMRDRFSAILIDEFQDTDPIQVEIAVLLATLDPRAGEKAWHETPVIPGRLFFVGDPKQSIYRFRRADIDLYLRAARDIGERGTPVGLAQNFRSRPGILEFVNAVFGQLFSLTRGEEAEQAPFSPLRAYREPVRGHSVFLLGGPVEPAVEKGGRWIKGGEAQRVRVIESREIASMLTAMGRPGSPLNAQPGERERRYSDIAILLPTRTTLPTLETALAAAGIPARIESRSLLFDTQEVRDLRAILAAIADPTDQVMVVAALRSAGFGCNDRDLLTYRKVGGHWNFARPIAESVPADDYVATCLRELLALHEAHRTVSVAALVERVIRECRLFQVAYAGRRPRESWQRLRFVQEQARAFDAATGRSLRQFLRFINRQAEDRVRVNETPVTEEDDDAVRIMTIHAAKGLEFPVVILAGLGTKGSNMPETMLWGPDGQGEVRVGSADRAIETPGYAALKAREDTMERLEDDRLLYVAATRARDTLIVSLYHPAPREADAHEQRHIRGTCAAAECLAAVTSSPEARGTWAILPQVAHQPGFPVMPEPRRDDTPADRDAWLERRQQVLAQSDRPAVLAATTLARSADVVEEPAEPEEQPWRKGRAGTSLGRAVHAVLQTVDLETGDGIDAAARAQAAAEAIPGRFAEVAELARRAIGARAVQEALASGRYWREVYVSTPVEGIVLEGFIDLLYETTDGLVVVDYKTDGIPADRADDLEERYRLQGATYAFALQQQLGRPVVECRFVFVQPGEERSVPDLAAAMAEVRALVRAKSQK